ncbi:MAG TPA: cytochrome P460 family protein [Aliidongia sp.]|uniref:cytochrome P460 family protein n=1 Tax=Aliidongia sp. TaxID=1914230 RepID=UPI002DDD8FEE|nr:cytochrome P460 family protein [Aliidongia sp.]HEV2675397.1 cytochrome P460 family protein [Aliidongia sp.]
MKRFPALALAAMTAVGVIGSLPVASGHAESEASPIYGVTIPPGYRQWELVGVAHEAGLGELRGVLGNAAAMTAYRAGTLPFPDGTILAKLAWKHVPSSEIDGAFVPGAATTVQIMVKDSKKYPATGGWGFGRFIDGKPVDEAQHQTCFACHQANVKGHDFVFTRYAR